jgi:hypothetical protein
MSRCMSVSEMKGLKYGRHSRLERPSSGTLLGNVYERLYAARGKPVAIKYCGPHLERLRDYYGLDIRRLRYGQYVLAGEWFGKVYVDYIAEHLNGSSDGGAA